MYIDYESAKEMNGSIDLKGNEVGAILKFIDEEKLNFNGECFSYSMGFEEVCSISKSLEKEAGVLLAIEKEFEYDAVLSKGTFEHTTIVLELADYFSFLVNEQVSAVTLYFSKENFAVAAALKLKRKEAIEQHRLVSETIETSYYHHSIDLPFSIEKDYFDAIQFQEGWGIVPLIIFIDCFLT